MAQSVEHAGAVSDAIPVADLEALDRWHELLTNRFVCEACLTRYFMKYRKCKACGAIGRIRLLTASLFDLADDDQELREIIARGQRLVDPEVEGERAEAGPGGGGPADETGKTQPPDFQI